MPVKADERRLYGHVASLPCQRCGAHGSQVAHSNQLRDGKGRGIKAFPWRVAALRRAVEQYRDLAQLVAQICRENPQGLQIRPLFGQQPRVVRRLRRAA